MVTGADGFVGTRLVPRLLDRGDDVIAAVRPSSASRPVDRRARTISLELADADSVRGLAAHRVDAVVHLAAVASGGDAWKDPAAAWETNAVGTTRLAEALSSATGRLLLVSTAEVYGPGPATPRVETDPAAPCSPYASSKLGAETAALETGRRTGLGVIITRSFAHTGAGQDQRYVVPAFAARLRAAKRSGTVSVRVGNLSLVREFLHVDDVVEAYLGLLAHGVPGEVYNVASGRGITLQQLFDMLGDFVGHRAVPEPDPALMRAADIPYLVGNAGKLRAATGWAPCRTLEQTLAEVASAQTN